MKPYLPKPFPFPVWPTTEVIDLEKLNAMANAIGSSLRDCVAWVYSGEYIIPLGGYNFYMPLSVSSQRADCYLIGDPKNPRHLEFAGHAKTIIDCTPDIGLTLLPSFNTHWHIHSHNTGLEAVADAMLTLPKNLFETLSSLDLRSYFGGKLVVSVTKNVVHILHNTTNYRRFSNWLLGMGGTVVYGVGVTKHRMTSFCKYRGLFATQVCGGFDAIASDPKCRPLHTLRQYIRNIQSTGTPHLVVLDTSTGGYSMEDNDPTRVVITPPCFNVIQFPVEQGGACCPYTYPFPPLLKLMSSLQQDSFYSGYYENNLAYPPFMRLTDIFTPHCPRVKSLEADRMLGKKVAKEIGLNVARYLLIGKSETLQDFDPRFEGFETSVALKYNNGRFIGIYNLDGVERKINPLLAHGDIIVEQYIGASTSEVNFSFMVSDSQVVPMLWLMESCKMFPNDSGGKIGLSMAIHCDAAHAFSTRGLDTHVSSCISRLHGALEGLFDEFNLFGWVDVSLMLDESTGVWYFTEWMFRNGVSNFACINAHLKTPYMDMWSALRTDSLGKAEFRSPVSLSTEVALVSFGGGDENRIFNVPSPTINGELSGLCKTVDGYEIRYCPIESGEYLDHRNGSCVVDASRNIRLGVFTITGGNLSDIPEMSHCLEKYLHGLSIPFSAYVCGHTSFQPLIGDTYDDCN